MTVESDLPVLAIDDAMQFVGDAALFVEITEMLLEEIPEQMGFIDRYWTERDLPALSKTAHRLKGNFGVVAAHQAHAAAKNLEHAAKAGDVAASESAVAALTVAVERVVPELERHLADDG